METNNDQVIELPLSTPYGHYNIYCMGPLYHLLITDGPHLKYLFFSVKLILMLNSARDFYSSEKWLMIVYIVFYRRFCADY